MMGAQGNLLVPAALIGWLPVVYGIFSRIRPYQAAAICFALGWMFLPVAGIPLKGLPDFTKVSATCVGIFIAAWSFDRERFLAFRLQLVDLPMALWCLAPLFASLTNGLGAYDGFAAALHQTFKWGLPYLVGRIYFTGIREISFLCATVFVGGLVYIPFCLEEIVMSPQLHRLLYGFHQHSFAQTLRGGGYRPMVFMNHGLMVAMWMVSASLIGLWLWKTRSLPEMLSRVPLIGGLLKAIPAGLLVAVQLATTVLLKSSGALFLMALGLLVLAFSSRFKTSLLLWLLICVPPTYMVSRTTGWWSGDNLTSFIAERFSEDRALSLQFRFDNEKILIDKALDGSFFGWGGWNRSRVFNEDGEDITVTDGLWIIYFGTTGIFGLTMLTLQVLLPVILLLYRTVPGQWGRMPYAPVAAMCILLSLYMVDNLLNAMTNPVFMLFNGGLCALLSQPQPLEQTTPELETRPPKTDRTCILTAVRTGATRYI